MAKKKEEEVILDVGGAYSKSEDYINKNKNTISTVVGILVVLIGGYLYYSRMYIPEKEADAHIEMWKAEQYFELDSFRLALNGDGQYLGFLDMIDDYSGTKSGNLANYYVGISYLRMKQFEDAIDYLNEFDSSDEILGPMAIGATGDAHMELGNIEEALAHYLKAANEKDNNFTTPIYLMKAAFAAEQLNDYQQAREIYDRIKSDHPETNEGRNIDKYLARAKQLASQ